MSFILDICGFYLGSASYLFWVRCGFDFGVSILGSNWVLLGLHFGVYVASMWVRFGFDVGSVWVLFAFY